MLICLDELNREIRAFLVNLLKQWISIIDEILTNTQQNCSASHFYNVMYDFPLPYTTVVLDTFFQTFRIMGVRT